MSVVDVWVQSSRAMVVVDTEVGDVENRIPCFEGSKMLYLPHANVIVACRGTLMFLGGLHSLMHGSPYASFDAYAAAMPATLAHTAALIEHQLMQAEAAGTFPKGSAAVHHEQQVVLVGYSDSIGDVSCNSYDSKSGSGFSEDQDLEEVASPWYDSWGPRHQVKTKQDAHRVGFEQIGHALRELPDSAHGGRLMLAELTRDGCSFSTMATVTTRAINC